MAKLIIRSEEKSIDFEPGKTLLDICAREKTSITFACKNGICGTCLIQVLEGANNISPKTQVEQEFLDSINAKPFERLACQCRLANDITVEVEP